MKPAPQLVRPSLPKWVLVLGVLAYAPVIVVLVVLVLELQDTRSTVDGRLATAVGRLQRATVPLSDAVTPVARAADADRPAAKRLTTKSLELTATLQPFVRELAAVKPGRQLQTISALATDLGERQAGVQLQKAGALSDNLLGVDAGAQIKRSGALADSLLGADVGGTVVDVRAMTRAIAAADLPRTARSLSTTTDELNRGTRLERLLVRLTTVLGQATSLRTVPSVDTAADAFTGRLLPLVEQGIALLRSTEVIARDTNRHAANLDRKLGGDLPLPGARSRGAKAP